MPSLQAETVTPPLKISTVLQSRWAIQVLDTAVELDVFSVIDSGAENTADIAAKLKTNAQATELLLNALSSLEFLKKSGSRYQLNELSKHYLVKDSPLFMGKYITQGNPVMEQAWTNLTDTIKNGKPQAQVNTDESAKKFFPQLAANIFPLNYTTACMVARIIGVESLPADARVLDIGAGSGVWSIPFAQAHPKLKVDALDFAEICQVTREFAEKFDVADRFDYIEGNWRDVRVPESAYDVVTLGHILHCEGFDLAKRLLQTCFHALKPGGQIVIAEFFGDEDATGPIFSQLFAINMFLLTTQGCIFKLSELKQMLEAIGFKQVRRLPLSGWGNQAPVVVATKD